MEGEHQHLPGGAGARRHAARLCGAIEALKEVVGATSGEWTVHLPLTPPTPDTVREQLGDGAFEAARATGRVMPLDEAIALALAEAAPE